MRAIYPKILEGDPSKAARALSRRAFLCVVTQTQVRGQRSRNEKPPEGVGSAWSQ
jgi:hypothetical protein